MLTQVQRSVKNGQDQVVDGRVYRGTPPQFFFVEGQWRQVTKGIPFVRLSDRKAS